ncbi:pinensin family lanthipeptide [Luteibaculum oceani]|uniref:pinensin family lanthipeptide n=1 Tax=Luteibaculum oceani TaxID=1294296 RepID=UPI001476E8E0|nr:pinensin family lanthipeptide [Luteibaculum oceani]
MNKKLKLSEVKVASFVTELNAKESKELKGKGSRETMFSCLDYISCNPLDCVPIEAR